jgi:hypothetical protein
MRRHVIVILGILVVVVASHAADVKFSPTVTDSVPSQYRYLYKSGLAAEEIQSAWGGLPYDSVVFERRAARRGPSFIFILRRGGSASYTGRANVSRLGSWLGKIDVRDYGRVNSILESLGILSLKPDYSAPWTDAPSTLLTVYPVGASAITVHEYADQGPPNLWAMHHSIEAAAEGILWMESK